MKRLVNFSRKHIFFIIVGNMIGVGVFITPNWVASQTSSPLSFLLTWVIGALIAVSGGIVYATLAKTFPQNGGDYQYLIKTSHKLVARAFASAMLWFAFPGSIASLALGAANYFHKLIRLLLPSSMELSIQPQIIAVIFIIVFLLLNLNRFKIAINIQQILVVILISGISIFILSTLFFNHTTLPAADINSPSANNWFMAILSVYFSYIGFASIGYIGGEIKLSYNKLKKWVVISVGTVSLLYILLNFVYVKFIPFNQLQNETATVFLILKDLPFVINLLVLLAITGAALGSLNVVMITGSRLFEFILKDNIRFKNKNYLNYSLIFISAVGIIYLFTTYAFISRVCRFLKDIIIRISL